MSLTLNNERVVEYPVTNWDLIKVLAPTKLPQLRNTDLDLTLNKSSKLK